MENSRVDKFIANPRRALFMLSLPIVIAMVVQTMYNVVDTAFVGQLGHEAIAALTFSFPLYFILVSINSGLGIGMGSLISRNLGAKNHKEAENVAIHGVLISVILAVVVAGLGLLTLGPLLTLFGAEGIVRDYAATFMRIIFFGVLLMFPAYTLNSIFSAEGDTKTPTIVQVIGLLVNILLDWILVPRYGVAGAAYSTVIAITLSLILYIFAMHHRSTIRLRFRDFSYSGRIVRNIFSVGTPATAMMVILSIYVLFINRILVHFGDITVAAFGIGARLDSVAMLPTIAIATAVMTLVGMFTGAKRHDLLEEIIRYSLWVNIGFTVAMGIVFFILAVPLVSIFSTEAELIRLSAAYLRLDVITFPLMAIVMTISRILQGMGKGSPSMTLQIVRVFVVAVPLAYIFVFFMGKGFLWVPFAMILGGLISSALAFIWLRAALKKAVSSMGHGHTVAEIAK